MNADNQEFRKKMNSLNRMMQDTNACEPLLNGNAVVLICGAQEQGLPHDLRRRLRSFFLCLGRRFNRTRKHYYKT